MGKLQYVVHVSEQICRMCMVWVDFEKSITVFNKRS